MTKTPYRSERLSNGLQVSFTDLSNRYFGDYHRLCIEVQIVCPLPEEPGDPFWQKVRAQVGPQLCLKRRLERMGVPTAEVECVREQMIDDFLASNRTYLQQPSYLRALADAELKRRRPRRLYHV